MSAQLSSELVSIINDRNTLKVLATADEAGVPHIVLDERIYVAENGNIHYLELLESSRSNHNLVASIWFDRKVSLAFRGADGRIFQITALPVKVHVTGRLFLDHYEQLRETLGDVDLTGVWELEPVEVREETFSRIKEEEETHRPIFRHLDRLAKYQNNN